MGEALSFAKITTPGVGTIVTRSRLLARLDHASGHKLTWISGPAGCGKTTLVADYVHKKKTRCLWYQVDRDDGDPAALFHFLRLAVKSLTRSSRRVLPPEYAPEFVPGLEVFARRFFRDVFARRASPVMIVFDNVQHAPADSPFYRLLREGLSELPPGSHAILISRSEPPSEFSGFLARREMAVIGWDDLRFTKAEVEEFFDLGGQKANAPGRAQDVLSVTQGWIAGIVLMTAAADHVDTVRRNPHDVPTRKLFDYFATEVFRKVGASGESFLLRSAFLPEMTVSQAEAMTANPDAEKILTRLSRDNFFTHQLSGRQPIYEYHPLFRAFLQKRAEALLSSDCLKALRTKAANLLEAAGHIEAAAELLIASQEWPGLSRLLCGHAPRLMAAARIQTLAGWVRCIPEDLRDQSPDLLYWDGVTRIGIEFAPALERLERSFALFQQRNDAAGQYLAWSARVDAIVAAWVDFGPFDRCIDDFKALRRRHPRFPSREIETKVLSNIVLAMVHRRICDPDLPVLADHLVRIVQEPMDLAPRASAGSSLIVCLCCWSDYSKAEMILEVMRPNSRRDCAPQTWILFHVVRMLFSWLTASFDDCRQSEKEATGAIRDSGAFGMEILVLHQALACALGSSDVNRSREILSRVSTMLNAGPSSSDWQQSYPLRWTYHYHFGWNKLLEGEPAVAREHMEWALNYADRMGDLFGLLTHTAVANVAIETGDVRKAEFHLAAMDAIDPHGSVIPVQVTKAFVEADLARRTGDRSRCLEMLRQAFASAKAHDLRTTEFWLPEQMAELCVLALEAGIEVEYVRTLARARDLRPRTPPSHLEAWPWPLTVETLGGFAVSRREQPLAFRGKAQRKPLDLLKALVAFGGRGVSIERLQDALWPDAEGDAAAHAFDVTLHRLRKLLQVEGVLERSESRVSLSANVCWVDVWALDDLMERASKAMNGVSPRVGTDEVEGLENRILNVHRGAFLEHLSDEPWASSARDQISIKLTRFFHEFGRYWEANGRPDKAVESYHRGLNVGAPSEVLSKRLTVALDQIKGKWKHIG